jgi:outer membrane protein TolC
VLEGAIAINEERVRLARTRFETGAASKLDFLQAQVDLDARRSDRARLQITLETAMGRVNELMGVPTFRTFTATDSIRLEYPLVDARATAELLERNAEVRQGRDQLRANERRLGEARALAWPRLVGGVTYGTNHSDNDFGSVLDSRSTGVTGSLALTWTLFDGWSNATQVTRARLQAASSRAQLETTMSRVQQQLVVARHRYVSDHDIVALEHDMVDLARENAEVALEAYRAGAISGLQLREAQNSHQQALERYLNASYQAKLSEIELMRINGDLVK